MNRLIQTTLVLSALVAAAAWSAPAGEEPDPQERLQRAEVLAGLTPLEGPGVQVILRHSPKPAPRGVDKRTLMIRDQDVNGVLNALRVAGAEALAIGDAQVLERVLVTTAAREVSGGVSVNGVLLRPPYRIYGLGNAAGLRGELFRPGGVIKSAALDTLDMVEVVSDDRLQIPAARQLPELRYARASSEEGFPATPNPLLTRTPIPTPQPEVQPRPLPERQPEGPKVVTGVTRRIPGGAPVTNPRDLPEAKPSPVPAVPMPRTPPATNPQPMVEKPVVEKPVVEKPVVEKPVVERLPVPVTGGVFGGKELGRFHKSGCRFGERILTGERVYFKDAGDARKAGRTPCTVCLAEQASRR